MWLCSVLSLPLTLAFVENFVQPYLRHISLITKIYGLLQVIKCPTRDTCLYTGENSRRRGLRLCLLSQFQLAVAQQPLGGFLSNLAHVCRSPGKIFWIWFHNISSNQRSHITKNMSFKGVCLSRS